jgi:hypothetical protein
MEQVRRREATSKSEFHQRLRDWLDNADDKVIGPEGINTPELAGSNVRDGFNILVLNADTPRDAVDRYPDMVIRYGNDLQWNRAESQGREMTSVEYGPEKLRCKSFNLYYVWPKVVSDARGICAIGLSPVLMGGRPIVYRSDGRSRRRMPGMELVGSSPPFQLRPSCTLSRCDLATSRCGHRAFGSLGCD